MERPKVGVGCFVVKDGKFLLGRRKNAHGNGTWCPPGGHLEFGEELEECASRETLEETGIKIKNIRFLTMTNDIHDKESKHYVTALMISDYDSGEVRLMEPDKFEQWAWFAWEDLPTPLFLPVMNLMKKGKHPKDY